MCVFMKLSVDPDQGFLYVKLKVFTEMKQVFNSDVIFAYILQFWFDIEKNRITLLTDHIKWISNVGKETNYANWYEIKQTIWYWDVWINLKVKWEMKILWGLHFVWKCDSTLVPVYYHRDFNGFNTLSFLIKPKLR